MTTNLIVTISASCGIILGFMIAVLASWLDRVLYRRERQRINGAYARRRMASNYDHDLERLAKESRQRQLPAEVKR